LARRAKVWLHVQDRLLAASEKQVAVNAKEDERSRAVDECLQFHYAAADELAPQVGIDEQALHFPRLCASACIAHAAQKVWALDVGCCVGRHTFELAREFEKVIGFDHSTSFIDTANKLKNQGELEYECSGKSNMKERRKALVPAGIDKGRCEFMCGDACNMKALGDIGQFDAVLAANLLCRLPDPHKFLADIAGYVRPGGVFVLVSPDLSREDCTQFSNWFGGCYAFADRAGTAVMSTEDVKVLLSEGFSVEKETEMPFLIRDNQRKYQLGCSTCLVLRRKDA